jgi:hypothetical protein
LVESGLHADLPAAGGGRYPLFLKLTAQRKHQSGRCGRAAGGRHREVVQRRFAARAGNDDIVEVSPVQAFAKDRRLARMRYAGRGMSDAEPVVSRLIVLTAMCGAR